MVTHLELDILKCKVSEWGDGIPVELFKILKVDAVKVLHSKKLLSHESCQIL